MQRHPRQIANLNKQVLLPRSVEAYTLTRMLALSPAKTGRFLLTHKIWSKSNIEVYLQTKQNTADLWNLASHSEPQFR